MKSQNKKQVDDLLFVLAFHVEFESVTTYTFQAARGFSREPDPRFSFSRREMRSFRPQENAATSRLCDLWVNQVVIDIFSTLVVLSPADHRFLTIPHPPPTPPTAPQSPPRLNKSAFNGLVHPPRGISQFFNHGLNQLDTWYIVFMF